MRTRPDASDLKQGPIENGWSAQLPFGSGGTVEEPDGSSRPSQKGDSVNGAPLEAHERPSGPVWSTLRCTPPRHPPKPEPFAPHGLSNSSHG